MNRRGFALVYAITALALLGALIALTLAGMRQGLENGMREQEAAQVRQLVLAGVQLARAGESGPVALPADLAGATLVIRTTPEGRAIEATLNKASLQIDCPLSSVTTDTPRW